MGAYILIARDLPVHNQNRVPERAIFAISSSGKEIAMIAYDHAPASLSPDASRLAFPFNNPFRSTAYSIRILALSNYELIDFDVRMTAGFPLIWSPDQSAIAFYEAGGISAVDTSSGVATPTLRCPSLFRYDAGVTCFPIAWSPDGRWLAHTLEIDPPDPRYPVDAVRLLDTNCLSSPDSCGSKDYAVMPLSTVLSWSPDSRYLATLTSPRALALFDVIVWQRAKSYTLPSTPSAITWSPDGDTIVFQATTGIYAYSISTGEASHVTSLPYDAVLLGWLEVQSDGAASFKK